MYRIKTETQKFLADIRRKQKRISKRAAKAANRKVVSRPSKTTGDRSRFYLCAAWRSLRYLALKNCDGRCQCCGAKSSDGVQLHVDHIKPRSQFPELELDLDNLQVLCADCNVGKGSWDQTNWREHFSSI